MKKIILWSLAGLLVVGIVGVIVLLNSLGPVVKTAVNTFGPKLTGTKVELAGASISPFSGSGTLTGLSVANPPGWNKPNAFSLGKITLSLDPKSLAGDHIVINEILIEAPVFAYETKLTDSNIAQLLANVEKFAGSADAAPADKSGKPVKIEVKKFRLTGAKVAIGVAGIATPDVPMPDISMDNLGTKEGGLTPDQLFGAVLKNIGGNIITVGKDAVLKAGTAVVGGVKDAAKGATDAAKNAVGGIKDLFGGGKK